MRQILLFAALAAVLALLLVSCGGTKDKPVPTEEDAPSKAAYHKISAEEAYEMMASQEGVVVDVRTREEYDGGHIENAVLVPNESIGSEMPEALPDKEATLLIYCRSGRRSKEAAQKLLSLGYQNVYDFGGVIDWPYELVKEGSEWTVLLICRPCAGLPEPQRTLPQQRSAGGEHLHQSHPRPPGAGGAEKGGNGGDPGGLGRRLPPDGRPRNPFSPAGGGGGEYPLCGLRVAQRGHRP